MKNGRVFYAETAAAAAVFLLSDKPRARFHVLSRRSANPISSAGRRSISHLLQTPASLYPVTARQCFIYTRFSTPQSCIYPVRLSTTTDVAAADRQTDAPQRMLRRQKGSPTYSYLFASVHNVYSLRIARYTGGSQTAAPHRFRCVARHFSPARGYLLTIIYFDDDDRYEEKRKVFCTRVFSINTFRCTAASRGVVDGPKN